MTERVCNPVRLRIVIDAKESLHLLPRKNLSVSAVALFHWQVRALEKAFCQSRQIQERRMPGAGQVSARDDGGAPHPPRQVVEVRMVVIAKVTPVAAE